MKRDPLYIDPVIKEELLLDYEPYPLFNAYNQSEIDDKKNVIDIKLKEKYRVAVRHNNSISKFAHIINECCQKCGTVSNFEWRKRYKCQNENCNGTIKFQCVSCDKTYAQPMSVPRHFRKGCKSIASVKCQDSFVKTKILNPYVRKLRKCKVEDEDLKNYRVTCPTCLKSYKNKKVLKAHQKSCKSKGLVKCEFCPFKSKYTHCLATHIKFKHIKSEKMLVNDIKTSHFHCNHCGYKSKIKGNIMSHLQHKHSELYPADMFRCILCNKNCGNIYRLNGHLRKKCEKNLKVVLIRKN